MTSNSIAIRIILSFKRLNQTFIITATGKTYVHMLGKYYLYCNVLRMCNRLSNP